jgi:beta-phosphoglucomutase-like phosphatase (HAD superfamily)
MDGVLFDTGEFHFQSWAQVLPEYGLSMTREQYRSLFGMKNEDTIPVLAGRAVERGLIVEIGELKETAFRMAIQGRAALLPGVRVWLDRFACWGLRQAIASSAPQANIDALVDEAGIRHYFDAVVAVKELPGKPDPSIFLAAASSIHVPAERCVVIEDAVAGVIAARRAGMKCIAVTTTNPAPALEKADLIVATLEELSEQKMKQFIS